MKASYELVFWKLYNRYTSRYRLEPDDSKQSIQAEDIGHEITKHIERIMEDDRLNGKITITIKVENL